ncbi:RES family NAD+ phosphorylase [Parafilimonas terrae]|jgi:RES domain-containing protein|uniref:RES domain-containing protein n=1 Tax=Parafilimonas terrae TaxID=1465490 RepID=A0A1I5SGL9_9BACT|nr:RES family NAD+ phosphorylase [Parafilimonas terrae]SFP69870.1 RES domain-containing protein [Parafilimonas terrae]
MLLYRIGAAKYANDVTGEGARLNGGRWNHAGIPCIYTGESRAIVLLEYSAHISILNIKRALSFTTFSVPDDSIMELKIATLPGNWKDFPHPKETRDLGSKLLTERRSLVIKIPSAIIPQEYIYLINPEHLEVNKMKIINVEDYAYDVRIKS